MRVLGAQKSRHALGRAMPKLRHSVLTEVRRKYDCTQTVCAFSQLDQISSGAQKSGMCRAWLHLHPRLFCVDFIVVPRPMKKLATASKHAKATCNNESHHECISRDWLCSSLSSCTRSYWCRSGLNQGNNCILKCRTYEHFVSWAEFEM